MRRRAFIAAIGGAVVALPAVVHGQETGRIYRLGYLAPFVRNPNMEILLKGLSRSGFVEGNNLILDTRGLGLAADRFSAVAAEFANAKVDVILTSGEAATRAAQAATTTIPILAIADDMVGLKLARSMARPGGNTTGISILASELDGKRQEILGEIVAPARRLAALVDTDSTDEGHLTLLREMARDRGVELSIHPVTRAEEINCAVAAAKEAGAAGLNVLASALFFARRAQIVERAAAVRLPAIYHWPETAEEGGLAGYGPRIAQLLHDVFAPQLVALLRGADPAGLPIQQPTKFDLVINLKTAKAIGLTVPQSLLARADKVIE